RTVIELKRVAPTHSSLETVRRKGLVQLQSYLDRLGETEGWLLIFDQRAGLSWEQRLWTETVQVEGKTIWLRGG
ncbi:MAG TPA: ATP-binding protein, partial [Myxococcota bacterium]|nr:ATP-binding protein [Myxococcota bacterium]